MHFMFSNLFSGKLRHLWDNVGMCGRARYSTDDDMIQCMCFAWWITKAIDTYSEYVMLMACPLRWQLFESTSMLCYMYIACLANCKVLSNFTVLYSTWPPLLLLWDPTGLYTPSTSFTLKVETTLSSETVQLHVMWLNYQTLKLHMRSH